MSRRNLEIIEERIKHGQEVHVVRVFDKNSRAWKKTAFVNDKNLDQLTSCMCEVVKTAKGEMTLSQSSIDVRDTNHELTGFAKVVIEELRPKLRLVVFGAGHVGQAVSLIGVISGLDVVVIDDRPEFASRQRLPDPRIDLIVGDYAKVINDLKIESGSAVVIVTRGHQHDEVCLRGTIRSNAGYLGMIGSKRRVLSIINRLEKDGFTREDFRNLHAPIGLKIGARSPQEIAVAILAEIINHFNGNKLS